MTASNFKDLTGMVFGRLTVVKRVENDSQGRSRWLCQCNCEDKIEFVVNGYSLTGGHTKSCGCLAIENARKQFKKKNIYYVWNDIVFVKFTNCEEYFICDLEDWDNLKQYAWRKTKAGYAQTTIQKIHYYMHRLVMNCPDNMTVDHRKRISDDGVCDNRKKNLRICSIIDNNFNRGIYKNNTSGYQGVTFNKRKGKWVASISENNKYHFLGYYMTPKEASEAYQKAKKKYHGEFGGRIE